MWRWGDFSNLFPPIRSPILWVSGRAPGGFQRCGLGRHPAGSSPDPAPTAPPAGLSVLPSGTVSIFPPASDGPSLHCLAISFSSPSPPTLAPHPWSCLMDDPGTSLGSPACPPLFSVLSPPMGTGECSLWELQTFHPNIFPRVGPMSRQDVPPSPSPQLHGKGGHQAC